jgi:hypothetical protein
MSCSAELSEYLLDRPADAIETHDPAVEIVQRSYPDIATRVSVHDGAR